MAAPGGLTGRLAERVVPLLPDAPLVIALSGGADSSALAALVADSGRPARALTVDHGLPASAALVAAAAEIAAQLGFPHQVVAVDPARGEDALRRVRLAALEAAARPGERIVTGHTADDQAETVLGNLLRGAGAGGLGGIPPQRGIWIRPLLEVTRDEARALALDRGLPFVDDPDNVDPAVRRSRLRTEVIPYLERMEGERVRPSLVRAGRLLAADDDTLAERADAVPVHVRGPMTRVAAAPLATLPAPIGSRVVRRALRTRLDPYPGSAAAVDAVRAVAAGGPSVSIEGGLLVSREGPWVVIGPPEPDLVGPAVLTAGASVEIGSWVLTASGSEDPRPLSGATARLCLDAGELIVRQAAAGDRLDIEVGSKPVVDLLREAGVGARFRPEWPVVEADGRMAWVAGVRVATWAAAGPDDEAMLIEARETAWTSGRS